MTTMQAPARSHLPLRRVAGVSLGAALALLAGCTSMIAGKKAPTTIYAPVAHAQAGADWPMVRWSLAIGRSYGARGDGLRIAVRPTPSELQVYKDSQWATPPGEMIEDAVLRTLEDSGRIATVSRQGSGVGADYRLLLHVRRFESDYGGRDVPSAVVEVTAKLLHVKSQQLAGSRTFLHAQPASGTAVPQVVAAFEQALAQTSQAIAGWTLQAGQNHGTPQP